MAIRQAASHPMARRPDSEAIRAAIRRFIEARHLQVTSWARRAKLSEGTLRNFLAGTSATMTMASLEKLAAAEMVTVGEMLGEKGSAGAAAPIGQSTAVVAAPSQTPSGAAYGPADLPVISNARGGLSGSGHFFENGFTSMTRTFRPVYLLGVAGAYAVNIVGHSMDPALKNGCLAYVNPSLQTGPGDDVVIVQTTGEWFVKELVRRTAKAVFARQHNPPASVEYPVDTVKFIHLIVGSTRVAV